MRACRLRIANFRGIQSATLLLPKHGVLIGDNNTGKTTIFEALDLVLGVDRLNRQAPVDEHDFFRGQYRAMPATPSAEDGGDTDSVPKAAATEPAAVDDVPPATPRIEIEVAVCDLSDEQKALFGDFIEFWDSSSDTFYAAADPGGVEPEHISEALRITFHGWYDEDEDDFEGRTFFTRSLTEGERPEQFSRRHKQVCGFLYLRSHRTGSRALSLERGSLLDIILRLKELRPQMWEDTLSTLSAIAVASHPDLGISPVLESISTSLKKYVPKEWGVEPHLRISTLTREHLRKVITAFIATGDGDHAAPYYRQGIGTINMLVLAMLSQIAEGRQNVIFSMEEPETAIPPYAQKRIVHEVRTLASQALFASHSPYVLEEFAVDETVVLERDADGVLVRRSITLPDSVKPKRYRQEFRTRFCEGLLSRRVLITEGATEASAFPVACRRLAELNPATYSSLEALGLCTIDAGSDANIPGMAQLYRELGKRAFALCDKQDDEAKTLIDAQTELTLMHEYGGFENLVLTGTSAEALQRFAQSLDWPPHLLQKYPDPANQPAAALRDFFGWSKGTGGIADFLAQCSEGEIPQWLRDACRALKMACTPAPVSPPTAPAPADASIEPISADGAH